MEITGEILLGKGIPGIKSGKLDGHHQGGRRRALAERRRHARAVGTRASPAAVTGKYEDGAFLVEADLGYEKGFAKGTVKVGAHQPGRSGADGKPAGPPKPDGSLTRLRRAAR